MPRFSRRTRFYTPTGLPDLIDFLEERPHAIIFAGGTYIVGRHRRKYFELDRDVAVITEIEELSRIHRTERYIEIGAGATISSILEIGTNVVPTVLTDALRDIGTLPIRNRATLGGNICVPEMRLNSYPALLLLDAAVELRSKRGSRWIQMNRFAEPDGTLAKQPGEVCTRIRVPFGDWNIQVFRTLGSGITGREWTVSFCGAATTRKRMLADLRFAFGSMGKTVVRDREIEAELIGRKLPLSERDRDQAEELLSDSLESRTPALSAFQYRMALRFFRWFISTIQLE